MTTTLDPPVQENDRIERLFKICLWVFIGSIGFSLAGTLLLKVFPSLMGVFGPYYVQLVKTPTWTYMSLMPVLSILMYIRSLGPALMAFFVLWGVFVGGMAELMGTTTGLPFGAYEYTSWLGPKLLDHVPYFIPASWFAMAIVCLDLAGRIVEKRWERVVVGSLFMVLWDVSLDPAMSFAFPFWTYPDGGFFFNMPAQNWLGWFIVSLVILGGYEILAGGLPKPSRWAPHVFFWNAFFPLMISLLYGLYVAVLAGAIALAIPYLLLWGKSSRHTLPT